MDVQTDLKDNWIIDIDYSNKSFESVETQLALGAIFTQIGESKKLIEYKYTNFNNKFDNILFDIPENIISKPKPRYRNYTYNSQKWIGHVFELSELVLWQN